MGAQVVDLAVLLVAGHQEHPGHDCEAGTVARPTATRVTRRTSTSTAAAAQHGNRAVGREPGGSPGASPARGPLGRVLVVPSSWCARWSVGSRLGLPPPADGRPR